MMFFTSIFTPAIVAAAISLLINLRASKLRDYQNYMGDEISKARNLIESAIKAAAEYYALSSEQRKPIHEAQVWLFERELRFCIPQIISLAAAEFSEIYIESQSSFDDFISQLTGSNFQSQNCQPDMKHIRRVAVSGSDLRAKLSQMRQQQLKREVEDDLLSKFLGYWTDKRAVIQKMRG